MISANGGLRAHRYTPQVTPRWPRGSEPASLNYSATRQARARTQTSGDRPFQQYIGICPVKSEFLIFDLIPTSKSEFCLLLCAAVTEFCLLLCGTIT